MRYYYNAGAKFLPELEVGTEVRLQNPDSMRWLEQGEIISKGLNRDYYIRLLDGKMRWRNQCFLLPMVVPSELRTRGGGDSLIPCGDQEREDRPRRSERRKRCPERLGV